MAQEATGEETSDKQDHGSWPETLASFCNVGKSHPFVHACSVLDHFFCKMVSTKSFPFFCQENPNFHQLAPKIAFGDAALGAQSVCPRDGRRGCALVDRVGVKLGGLPFFQPPQLET